MHRKLIGLAAVIIGLLVTSGPALAHHGSRALYNMSKQVTLTGTVTYFAWQNPHVYVLFDVKDSDGHVAHWGAETYSPTVLERDDGWSQSTLKHGQEITITVWPAKTGALRGYISKVVIDGKTYVIATH
jgi:Family of unknown function (DUF6152)